MAEDKESGKPTKQNSPDDLRPPKYGGPTKRRSSEPAPKLLQVKLTPREYLLSSGLKAIQNFKKPIFVEENGVLREPTVQEIREIAAIRSNQRAQKALEDFRNEDYVRVQLEDGRIGTLLCYSDSLKPTLISRKQLFDLVQEHLSTKLGLQILRSPQDNEIDNKDPIQDNNPYTDNSGRTRSAKGSLQNKDSKEPVSGEARTSSGNILVKLFERADDVVKASTGGRPTGDYEPRHVSRIRLEKENIDWLKEKGPNHLSRINGILTALREAEENLDKGP